MLANNGQMGEPGAQHPSQIGHESARWVPESIKYPQGPRDVFRAQVAPRAAPGPFPQLAEPAFKDLFGGPVDPKELPKGGNRASKGSLRDDKGAKLTQMVPKGGHAISKVAFSFFQKRQEMIEN